MIFKVGYGEADIVGYFWEGSGLFSCRIGSVVFGEANVTQDSDESDLGADRVKGMKVEWIGWMRGFIEGIGGGWLTGSKLKREVTRDLSIE